MSPVPAPATPSPSTPSAATPSTPAHGNKPLGAPVSSGRRFRAFRRPAILLAAVLTTTSLGVAFGPSLEDFSGASTATAGTHYGRQSSVDGGNWAGILIPSGSFSSVRSSWTEPSVDCRHRSEIMAPWVGIDGQNNHAVEQTGVETSCESGRARYRAWYEVYPAPAVYYRNTVRAGDKMTASVTRSGSRFTMTLTNRTRGWTRSTTRTHHTDHSSAEVVVESPNNSFPSHRTVRFGTTTVNGHPVTHYSLLRMHTSSKHNGRNYTSSVHGNTHFSVSYSRS